MKNPKVTVLMPVYNGEKYLKKSIESILDQTFTDFEFLIIDDGSTDESLELIKSYDDTRIKIIVHEQNKGLIKTLNEGIELAAGDYVARMDGDDVSLPERLEKQIAFMDNNQDVAVCGTWTKSMNENGKIVSTMKSLSGILLKYNYWKPSPMIHPSVMMRKSLIKEFLFSVDAASAEDYDLWLRIVKKHRIFNIKECLLLYRIHGENISTKRRDEQLLSSYNSFLKNFEIENISLEDFLAVASLNLKVNPVKRLAIILKIKNKIKYSCWFMIFDSAIYTYRWLLNTIK